jgi:hypothetical protein
MNHEKLHENFLIANSTEFIITFKFCSFQRENFSVLIASLN